MSSCDVLGSLDDEWGDCRRNIQPFSLLMLYLPAKKQKGNQLFVFSFLPRKKRTTGFEFINSHICSIRFSLAVVR